MLFEITLLNREEKEDERVCVFYIHTKKMKKLINIKHKKRERGIYVCLHVYYY